MKALMSRFTVGAVLGLAVCLVVIWAVRTHTHRREYRVSISLHGPGQLLEGKVGALVSDTVRLTEVLVQVPESGLGEVELGAVRWSVRQSCGGGQDRTCTFSPGRPLSDHVDGKHRTVVLPSEDMESWPIAKSASVHVTVLLVIHDPSPKLVELSGEWVSPYR